jgi:hypothetical protein
MGRSACTRTTPVDVVVDLTGTFGPTQSLRFVPSAPRRMIDTRAGDVWRGPIGVGQTLDFFAAPSDAAAVNRTAVVIEPFVDSYHTGTPCGAQPGGDVVREPRRDVRSWRTRSRSVCRLGARSACSRTPAPTPSSTRLDGGCHDTHEPRRESGTRPRDDVVRGRSASVTVGAGTTARSRGRGRRRARTASTSSPTPSASARAPHSRERSEGTGTSPSTVTPR